MRIAGRVSKIKPSGTLRISARIRALRDKGLDIIGFGAGEPDFDTPEPIKQAAVAALEKGATKYTPVSGIPELRKAAAEELSRAHRVPFCAEEIMVSCGAKHSLYNVFMALLDEGDEVIVPVPTWVSHTEIVRLAGGVPVLLTLDARDGFDLDVERLRRLITPRTRAILLGSPSNPTGGVYSEAAVRGVAELLRQARNPDLFIITDDLYRSILYDGATWHSVLHFAPELRDQVVVVDGVSKTYAMTGWRVGFSGAPRRLIAAMEILQGQMITSISSISQHAALFALTGGKFAIGAMVDEFDRRREVMLAHLRSIPGVECTAPRGAFYCFPDVRAYLDPQQGSPLHDDVALSEWLIDNALVAAVPGTNFWGPGHLRFSYATSLSQIEEGMRRLRQALASLGPRSS